MLQCLLSAHRLYKLRGGKQDFIVLARFRDATTRLCATTKSNGHADGQQARLIGQLHTSYASARSADSTPYSTSFLYRLNMAQHRQMNNKNYIFSYFTHGCGANDRHNGSFQ